MSPFFLHPQTMQRVREQFNVSRRIMDSLAVFYIGWTCVAGILRFCLAPLNAILNNPEWAFVLFALPFIPALYQWAAQTEAEAEARRTGPSFERRCPACGVPLSGTWRCVRCNPVSQRSFGFGHMTKIYSDFPARDAPRGGDIDPGYQRSVAAYLFAYDEDVPRIVQVKLGVRPVEGHTAYSQNRPNFELHIQWPSAYRVAISDAFPAGPQLGRDLSLYGHWVPSVMGNPSKLNRCVQRLTGGSMYLKWRDDIMLFRNQGEGYADVREGDLTAAIEYLRDYGRPTPLF